MDVFGLLALYFIFVALVWIGSKVATVGDELGKIRAHLERSRSDA